MNHEQIVKHLKQAKQKSNELSRAMTSLENLLNSKMHPISYCVFSDLMLNASQKIYEDVIKIDTYIYDLAIDSDEECVVSGIVDKMKC